MPSIIFTPFTPSLLYSYIKNAPTWERFLCICLCSTFRLMQPDLAFVFERSGLFYQCMTFSMQFWLRTTYMPRGRLSNEKSLLVVVIN